MSSTSDKNREASAFTSIFLATEEELLAAAEHSASSSPVPADANFATLNTPLGHLILSQLILSYRILSYLIVSYRILSYLIIEIDTSSMTSEELKTVLGKTRRRSSSSARNTAAASLTLTSNPAEPPLAEVSPQRTTRRATVTLGGPLNEGDDDSERVQRLASLNEAKAYLSTVLAARQQSHDVGTAFGVTEPKPLHRRYSSSHALQHRECELERKLRAHKVQRALAASRKRREEHGNPRPPHVVTHASLQPQAWSLHRSLTRSRLSRGLSSCLDQSDGPKSRTPRALAPRVVLWHHPYASAGRYSDRLLGRSVRLEWNLRRSSMHALLDARTTPLAASATPFVFVCASIQRQGHALHPQIRQNKVHLIYLIVPSILSDSICICFWHCLQHFC